MSDASARSHVVHPQAAARIASIAASGEPPMESLEPAEARRVANLRVRNNGWPSPGLHAVEDRVLRGPGGDVPIRIYKPHEHRAPLILFFHGGARNLPVCIASVGRTCRSDFSPTPKNVGLKPNPQRWILARWRIREGEAMKSPITLMLAALLVMAAAGCVVTRNDYDPAVADPPVIDTEHPPALIELAFDSHGSSLNGHLYLANGSGPHPTIVSLHGFPGHETDQDLAQAYRRAGFNVLSFHYRGSWGSEGSFSTAHIIEDVAAALAFLSGDAARKDYRVNPQRLILIGHSMGGFAALMGASRNPDVRCVAGIAPANLAVMAAGLADPEQRAGFIAYVDGAGPIQGATGTAVVEEMIAGREAFDLARLAPSLSGKSILLIGAQKDEVLPPAMFHVPLVAAYRAEPDIELTHAALDSDHSFSWSRISLANTVVDWLDRNCR